MTVEKLNYWRAQPLTHPLVNAVDRESRPAPERKALMLRVLVMILPPVLVLLLVLYGLISYLIASGVTKADRKEQEDNPAAYGLPYDEVEFPSRRGDVALRGWLVPSVSGDAALLFVHGIGSVRSGDRAVELASRLVENGYTVLMFDLRGHGSSGGSKVSGGYLEQWDVLGAYDYLVSRGFAPGRIALVGFSMGAATAILAAAQEPGFTGVVADSPYARASEIIAHEAARKTVIPRWIMPIFVPTAKQMASWFFDIDIGSLAPEKAVKGLPYPILVIHGLDDIRVPHTQGERVHAVAPPGSEIWLVPGVDHVDAFATHPEEYSRRVIDYLEARFRAKQP